MQNKSWHGPLLCKTLELPSRKCLQKPMMMTKSQGRTVTKRANVRKKNLVNPTKMIVMLETIIVWKCTIRSWKLQRWQWGAFKEMTIVQTKWSQVDNDDNHNRKSASKGMTIVQTWWSRVDNDDNHNTNRASKDMTIVQTRWSRVDNDDRNYSGKPPRR